jgi:hyperosmotically inducible protein
MSRPSKAYAEEPSRTRAALRLAVAAGLLASVCGCRVLRDYAGPAAYVGDSAIDARIEIALVHSPSVDARQIDVQTYHGQVTLEGTVDTAAMKRQAERIARAAPGVRRVENRLRVAAPEPPGR